MNKNIISVLIAITISFCLSASEPLTTKLFPEGSPSVNGLEEFEEGLNEWGFTTNVSDPEMMVFLPNPAIATGQGLLVVPGGAYKNIAIPGEGYPTAKWLNDNGIAAFVLKYRLPNGHPEVILEDGKRAMEIIRDNADQWGLVDGGIGAIGFSAGGHFVGSLITQYDEVRYRPDFAVLVYPVISMEFFNGSTGESIGATASSPEKMEFYSLQNRVKEGMPPVFMVLTDDDTLVPPANSVYLYQALKEYNVPAELHIFPSGGHGFWMGGNYKYGDQTYPMILRWISQFI